MILVTNNPQHKDINKDCDVILCASFSSDFAKAFASKLVVATARNANVYIKESQMHVAGPSAANSTLDLIPTTEVSTRLIIGPVSQTPRVGIVKASSAVNDGPSGCVML